MYTHTRYFTKAHLAILLCAAVLVFGGTQIVSAQQADDYGTGGGSTVATYCPKLTTTMQRGARDATTVPVGQVSELQRFLADYYDMDPEELVTGFFGRITQGYVQKFQSEQGLPAYGIVGSLTRASISRVCGGGGGSTGTDAFSATPSSGSAPLAVTFSTRISGFHPDNRAYVIDFGDGQSEPAANCYAPTDYCLRPGTNAHTYASSGTYTAKLLNRAYQCQTESFPPSLGCPQDTVLGAVTIRVGGTISCNADTMYRPVCGQPLFVCNAPAGVACAQVMPAPKTYASRCAMESAGATLLYEGECKSGPRNCPIPMCAEMLCGPGTHREMDAPVYGADGCRTNYCSARCVPDVNTNLPPTISSFSGPTVLSVGQSGTWTVGASDPENGTLSYSVTWGDQISVANQISEMSAGSWAATQQTTFTHSYQYPGNYTVTVVVRDASGLEAKTSTTVSVGDQSTQCPKPKPTTYCNGTWETIGLGVPDGIGACTTGWICRQSSCTDEYAPVCGKKTSYNSCVGSMDYFCAMWDSAEQLKTYTNTCQMYADNATYVSSGACVTGVGPTCPIPMCAQMACAYGYHPVSDTPTFGADGCRSNHCAVHCEAD